MIFDKNGISKLLTHIIYPHNNKYKLQVEKVKRIIILYQ